MANLLERSSLVLTPTAYNNGEALCIKPSDGSGDFDFSRNSAATRVNAQGLVENVQILSSNLVQNPSFSEIGSEEVSNGSFSQEGAEQISNGNFSNWTNDNPDNWIVKNEDVNNYVTESLSGGELRMVSDNTATLQIRQENIITSGVTYKIDVDVTEVISGSIRFQLNNQLQTLNTVGSFTFYVTADVSGFFAITRQGVCDVTIDNCSVREVGQDWTLGNGWSVGEDKAVCDGTQTSVSFLTQNGQVQSGKIYKVTYEVVSFTSGEIIAFIGGSQGQTRTSVGTYTEYLSTSNTNFWLRADANFIGSITNISVKEVGQDWVLSGVDFSLGSVFFNSDVDYISQTSISFTNGKKYKLTFEGSGNLAYRTGFTGADGTRKQITLPHTAYLTATADTNRIQPYGANGNLEGTLTNISIIEISTDTNLPRINYEGFSYQDALGSELVTNGDFSNPSNWDLSTGWSIADGKATYDGLNGTRQLISSGTSVFAEIGKAYKVSFDVLEQGSGANSTFFGGVLLSTDNLAVGSYVFYGTAISTGRFGIFGREGSVFSIDNVSVKEYLGQEVVPNSGCGHYLFEPASRNLLPYSELFNNSAWSKTRCTIDSGGHTSPSGESNAFKMTATDNDARLQDGNSPTGVIYTQSIYVKSATGSDVSGQVDFSGTQIVTFTATDQWQRVTTTSDNTRAGLVRVRITNSGDELYIWGAMLEAQSYSTSYIPTNGQANGVSRNQDVCINGATGTGLINSTSGVLYAEMASLSNTVVSNYISISDGTYNNRLSIFFTNGTNIIRAFYVNNGVVQVNKQFVVSDITEFHKVAFKFKENDFALWIDGVKVGSDTSGSTLPSGTLTKLSFSEINSAANAFKGKTKALAVWKEALSDSELQSLTTI